VADRKLEIDVLKGDYAKESCIARFSPQQVSYAYRRGLSGRSGLLAVTRYWDRRIRIFFQPEVVEKCFYASSCERGNSRCGQQDVTLRRSANSNPERKDEQAE
jgi:hypothetical protein